MSPPVERKQTLRTIAVLIALAIAHCRAESHRDASPKTRRLFAARALTRPLQQLSSSYGKALQDQPLLTNMATGATLACLSDVICQKALEKRKHLDWRRIAALTTWGGLYDGGINHFIANSYVDKLLPGWFKLTPIRQGMGCTALDNFVTSPVIYLPSYYLTNGLLQGDNLNATLQRLQDKWWPSLRSCWNMWIPFQVLNFGFVPAHLRVVTMNVGNVAWNIIMDVTAHGSHDTSPANKDQEQKVEEQLQQIQNALSHFSAAPDASYEQQLRLPTEQERNENQEQKSARIAFDPLKVHNEYNVSTWRWRSQRLRDGTLLRSMHNSSSSHIAPPRLRASQRPIPFKLIQDRFDVLSTWPLVLAVIFACSGMILALLFNRTDASTTPLMGI
eukprot:gnl/TRDRNA2_/TRDRNA2_201410_c0_seq1.p1 gnl/TRDRNA2_/TRDRNA2_201410_c0~~gnl/TRDRNA2_/TRDRNA2_201410_c0_seq1.p1  ORF type:complete len:389 (+),score=37.16 gnl/TRDRNA2_/TRDRNA2_201410_c0_seq1:111-1277(+)